MVADQDSLTLTPESAAAAASFRTWPGSQHIVIKGTNHHRHWNTPDCMENAEGILTIVYDLCQCIQGSFGLLDYLKAKLLLFLPWKIFLSYLLEPMMKIAGINNPDLKSSGVQRIVILYCIRTDAYTIQFHPTILFNGIGYIP